MDIRRAAVVVSLAGLFGDVWPTPHFARAPNVTPNRNAPTGAAAAKRAARKRRNIRARAPK